MPIVELEDLVKSYGGPRVLDGVSMEISEGQILGLLGPNGSGKTTTVSILSTLLRPDGGRASICGYDVASQAAKVREVISLTGQYASLDGALTVRENVTMFGRLTGLGRRDVAGRIDEVIETFGLGEFVDRKVSALSGGMRRRADIACALVTRPRVLFLDEPTTGLDPQSRAAVWQTVAALRDEGITVLLTTQYLEEADRLADNIVMLDHGSVVLSGTPEQLKGLAGAAICDVTLADGADLPRAEEVLARFDPAPGDTVAGARPKISLAAPDGLDSIGTVVSVLQEAAIDVSDIALRRPSLDEVFFRFVSDVPAEQRS
ncbi:putative ABC transporter ATP-binding protein [Gordonia effusa NBRC 100432]|uniref:Putative ABC transporter ATP-binding protein n=1 Tax=Gordonia effusa NBRC 100432 TaxID=1077974 RepID=H0QXR4_9ACTN|nr:daunorubicin resistance protein DrrA family ABC transporter ATP-binding protein [Gordonia effusa]GAB17615.1 putative ABC transporter ATP-binding protein [Gordonia effusa NBRC 100432]